MLICRASVGDSPLKPLVPPRGARPSLRSVSNPPMLLIPREPKQQMRKCLGAFRSTQNFLSKQIEGGAKKKSGQ